MGSDSGLNFEKRIYLMEIEPSEKDEPKISDESAKEIFQRILDYYDIDFQDIVSDQGKNGAETLRNKFIRAIMKGKIETNMSDDPDKGFQIIQNSSTGITIAYNEYNAVAAEQGDRGKGQSSAQYELLGSLCGKGSDYIKSKKNLRGPDLKLAEYIAVLFLL